MVSVFRLFTGGPNLDYIIFNSCLAPGAFPRAVRDNGPETMFRS
jgi:hypothetical protein